MIFVTNNIQHMTGEGEEWLTDQYGQVIARFLDGNFISYTIIKLTYSQSNELTLKVA